jgi:luciferase-type oxidoreductase
MKSFEKINNAFNSVFRPGKMSLGVFFAIESYEGSIPQMKNQVELAQKAEALGFSALWFRDVPMHVPSFGDMGQIYDPWVYLGYIAGQTKKISLVTGSIILPLRHPIHVAKAAASIDTLTNGRLILGVASGDRLSEYPAFKKDASEKAELFRDSFNYIRNLEKDFPTINSRLGNVWGDIDLLPKPCGARLPMLVTGFSGQNLEWIAGNSDGWIYYPRNVRQQEMITGQWRKTLQATNSADKPFAQSFYIDLAEDKDASPIPIHLGYRLGRKALLEILYDLYSIGVNHVVFNLKYGSRPAAEVLEEIGEFILPHFLTGNLYSNFISPQCLP